MVDFNNYKRLTGQKWSDKIDLKQEYGYSHIYKRLYELEDKIEDGTLIEIPIEIPCVRYNEDRNCWQVIYEQMGIMTTCNCGSKEDALKKGEKADD